MKKIGFIILLLTIISACKKEDISPGPELNNDPVFKVTGTIGGQAVSFQGGVDGAYLNTYTDVVNGVNRYSGRLIKGNDYVDFGVFNGNLFLPNSNLTQAGNQLDLTTNDVSEFIHIDKNSFINHQTIQTIQVSVNGVDQGASVTITEPGVYDICVTIYYSDLNTSSTTVCNQIILGYKDLAPFTISSEVGVAGVLNVEIQNTSSSATVNNVNWYLDSESIGSGLEYYGNMAPGIHKLQAVVTFSNGIVRTRTIGVNSGSDKLFLQDINGLKNSIPDNLLQDFKAQFKVRLNGIDYEHIASNSQNEVQLTGFEYFGKNSQNKSVYKVSGVVSTQMRNMGTNEIENGQFYVVFGLEIP